MADGPTKIEVAHYNKLVGKKIVRVEFSNDDIGLLPLLIFEDGCYAFVMCDPEGNGPGFLDIYDPTRRDH